MPFLILFLGDLAKEAGFDGAEFRYAKWGGSVENRALKIMLVRGYEDVGMPLEQAQETFTYLVNEADKIRLYYIALVGIRVFLCSLLYFTGNKRGIPHNIVAAYGPLIKKAKILVNSGVRPEEGAELVQSGQVDVVSIGFNWATPPDVANRIQHGKPLDNIPNIANLQLGEDIGLSVGLTDYPEATY
ncbi:hypothetical protein DL96DRAFT_1761220 [Flagelloscypha sp. PMI_526]|nr:hypothetical protein DL96DRAFT_1761220 [Flagelloscypha sp. PMI_526]